MEQIVIELEDKEKAKMLLDLLNSLNFVKFAKSISMSELRENENIDEENEFFPFAGLWEDRDISLASLRQKAWPRL